MINNKSVLSGVDRNIKSVQNMGRFVNPDNSAFRKALNSEIYVDKTGLLEYMNLGYD